MIPATEQKYLFRFQKKQRQLFYDAWRFSRLDPRYGAFWLRTIYNQKRMASRRNQQDVKGLHIPPVMIFSVTSKCNLRCKGCYAMARHRDNSSELPRDRVRELFSEASQLGIGIIMLAGGEPLMRPDILEVAAEHDEIIFPVFTNGLMLRDEKLELFRDHKNLIPVLSLEGNREQTDQRRGVGLHKIVAERARSLKNSRKFYGLSLTLTSDNYDDVLNPELVRQYYNSGCKLFFIVEYVPESVLDLDRCLTDKQKESLQERLGQLRKEFPALFVSLPGDEEQYGGCLAAGRGFVHISSTGKLEPCPFAPFSDTGLEDMSLEEALNSEFLERIRKNHEMLSESKGGCSLWENRDWVLEQLNNSYNETA